MSTMLLFFGLLASSANALVTHPSPFAAGVSVGLRWPLTSLSSFKNKGEMQSIPEFTEDNVVPDDPVESRLLPLLKKIFECQIPEVAELGPYLLQTLRKYKPVDCWWVNDAMKCWRQHPDLSEQVENPEELLQAMLSMCDEYPSLEPNRYSYGFVVGARTHHAKEAKDIRSMQRAEQYLSDMWTRWGEPLKSGETCREHPGLFMYQTVFRGWLKFAPINRSTETQAYQNALSLLVEMKDLCQEGFIEYKPDNRFLEELKYLSFHVNKCRFTSLPILEGIVRELEASYNGDELRPDQLKSFANLRREMIARYMQNKQFDTESTISRMLSLMNEWWEMCRYAEDPFTRLNAIYMNKFITAAARSKIKDKFPRSQALFQEMWRLHRETGDDSIKPDGITYSSLINALSNSKMKNAGERAEGLFQEMWHLYNSDKTKNKALKPDVVTCGNMIQVWLKSGDKNGAEKAERLLREMWDRYNGGDEDVKPSNSQYNQVISAVGNLGGSEGVNRAEALLQEMWDLYNSDTTKNKALKPNAITYSHMMQAWVKSNEPNAAERVEALLQAMWDRYNNGDIDLEPSYVHHNHVSAAKNGTLTTKRRFKSW